jgi:hypothetical protein
VESCEPLDSIVPPEPPPSHAAHQDASHGRAAKPVGPRAIETIVDGTVRVKVGIGVGVDYGILLSVMAARTAIKLGGGCLRSGRKNLTGA